MLGRLFSRSSQSAPSVPEGFRVYAVGDVHGRDDLLADLLSQIEQDHGERGPAHPIVVFLGDLIDRGPQSAQVVERLRRYATEGLATVFLAGNHEEVMLRVLAGQAEILVDWLRFGGTECLQSYGVDVDRIVRMAPQQAVQHILGVIPSEHLEFLRSMGDTFRLGDYLFVHAGIRPGVPLSGQRQSDLRWIRHPFLTDRRDHGFFVVHGHTIAEDIDECVNRIGIDTGAYSSGVLTAIGLEGQERWFLQCRSAS